jgi:hypothetical protein
MDWAATPGTRADARLSERMLLVLRDRVASRYYDRPEVIDALARAISSRAGLPPS